MARAKNPNIIPQDPLFDDGTPKPETPIEVYRWLERMAQPSVKPHIERSTDFPEERTMGEGHNTYTPQEGTELERLTTQNVSYEQAFFEATGRAYIPPTPEKPIYDGKGAYKPHPIKPSSRLRGIADERSSKDPWLR